MIRRLRPRSVYDVLAALGFFIALATGGAYAANTVFSTDIVDGQVKTVDLGDGAVTVAKIANGSITTDKVKDDSLKGRDIEDNSLKGADVDESTLSSIGGGGSAGGDLTGTYPNPEIAAAAVGSLEVATDSLTTADIAESTLGQVPSALLGGIGRQSGTAPECDAEGVAGLVCASAAIDLPAPTSVLAIATVKAQGGGTGQCQLNLQGPGIFKLLALSGFDAGTGINAKFVPLIAITDSARLGSNRFEIECNELAGELTYFDARVVAVALSSS